MLRSGGLFRLNIRYRPTRSGEELPTCFGFDLHLTRVITRYKATGMVYFAHGVTARFSLKCAGEDL